MDDIVAAALVKWPHVPHCYGWLGLDARGQWFMRDEQAQQAGPFAGPQATVTSRGSLLRHDKLIAFIERNYMADAQGQWCFQNGPQRVYVELEATPWVWRLSPDGSVCSHTGQVAHALQCITDEQGRVYLQTNLGFGLVHTLDTFIAAQAIEQGQWAVQTMQQEELPRAFAYVLSPQGGRGL